MKLKIDAEVYFVRIASGRECLAVPARYFDKFAGMLLTQNFDFDADPATDIVGAYC